MFHDIHEECGVFGVYGHPEASNLTYLGLYALQHRGQEGAGICSSDGRHLHLDKAMGLIADIFNEKRLKKLPGHIAIGHNRYSTAGSSILKNVQPILANFALGPLAIAHNGNLVNAAKLRQMYQAAGAIFQTSTESEVLVHLLADPMFRNRPRRVARALSELKGSFSYLIMTKDCVMAARDPFGFKPLSIGRLEKGYVFTSETCALNQIGAEFVRDVLPGELIVADQTGLNSFVFADPNPEGLSQCIFEHVYFARPDSIVISSARRHASRNGLLSSRA